VERDEPEDLEGGIVEFQKLAGGKTVRDLSILHSQASTKIFSMMA
jgi:hypothetical protein